MSLQVEFPAITILDSSVYRDRRDCYNCGGPQTFVEVYRSDAGRVGYCDGCGEKKLIPWTRENSEAA
jgi:hypothetical protein